VKRILIYSAVILCVLNWIGLSGVSSAGEPQQILFKNATIDISEGFNVIPQDWLDTKESSGYYLVHFKDRIQPTWKTGIATYGEIKSYIPYNTYLVKLDLENVASVTTLQYVDWIGYYQPYFKVDQTIYTQIPEQGRIKLRINLYGGEQFKNAEQIVRGFDGQVLNHVDQPHGMKLVCLIPETNLDASLKALAFLPEVEWIQNYPDYDLCNDYTQWVCQSGPYAGMTTPVYDQGIYGAGQVVGVMDTGADADMCYFYDAAQGLIVPNVPNFDQRKIPLYPTNPGELH